MAVLTSQAASAWLKFPQLIAVPSLEHLFLLPVFHFRMIIRACTNELLQYSIVPESIPGISDVACSHMLVYQVAFFAYFQHVLVLYQRQYNVSVSSITATNEEIKHCRGERTMC